MIRVARRARGAGALCLLLLFIAGCGSSASGPAPQRLPRLNWWNNIGPGRWVRTLDPADATDPESIGAVQMVNANLVRIDPTTLKPLPDLAKRWVLSADHLTWTFFLRPHARFSNGDPVTASDVVWSLTRALLPATKSTVAAAYLSPIEGAIAVAAGKTKVVSGLRAVGSHTVRIRLTAPAAYFLAMLSYPTGDVLDRRVMQGKTANTFLTNSCGGTVGAGPFVFVCRGSVSGPGSFYASGDRPAMSFAPNPNYYGAKPRIDVYAPFYNTTAQAWKAFGSGRLDGAPVPVSAVSSARGMAGFSRVPALTTDFLSMNDRVTPFYNIHCRLAVSYALNRPKLTSRMLSGTEGPLYGVVPPGLSGYISSDAGLPSFDQARARRELAACPGHLRGTTLTYQSASAVSAREYREVGAELRAVGAKVKLRPLSLNDWILVVGQPLTVTARQERITENLWPADYPDAHDWLGNLLHTGGAYNIGGYHDPNFDRWVNDGDVEFDSAARARDYRAAQRVAVTTGGWVGIGYRYNLEVVNKKRIRGVVNSAFGLQPDNGDWSQVRVLQAH